MNPDHETAAEPIAPPLASDRAAGFPPPADVDGGTPAAERPIALPEGVAAWFRDHRSTVYRYVRFRVASREVAEDLTSDVFMKALRSYERYDSRRAAPSTWLLRIARNTLLDHFRALRRRGSLHVSLDRAHDLAARGPSPEEQMLREERLQTLLNASSTLRAGDQEILSLRYGAGLLNHEIAESLGITPNAVAVRLHRALQRLREAVDRGDGHLPRTTSDEARASGDGEA